MKKKSAKRSATIKRIAPKAKPRKRPASASDNLHVCPTCYAISVKRKTALSEHLGHIFSLLTSVFSGQQMLMELQKSSSDTVTTLAAYCHARAAAADRSAETLRTLADHCARLLKEKETLQKQVAAMRESDADTVERWVKEANGYTNGTSFSDETVAEVMRPPVPVSPEGMHMLMQGETGTEWHQGCQCANCRRIYDEHLAAQTKELAQRGIAPLPSRTHEADEEGRILANSGAFYSMGPTAVLYCRLSSLHRPGIRCDLCGDTPVGYPEPAPPLHVYDDRRHRCKRCFFTREAIEAGGLACAWVVAS